ncbi:MAG: hypothetical protein QOK48_3088 [Blastocatellia bacterium]|nr:hypothetical protein [Blastocatellia bacterium]
MPAKTFSQQTNDKQAEEALRQRAYEVLESLAEQIDSLRSGENRARMGSNIAGSLWPHNEARAREMFATVTKEIKAGLQGDAKDLERYLAKPNFMKLREDTALRIGMFDPEWALQFLNDTKPIDAYVSDQAQSELNLRLAMVCADRNPDVALRLGRESLKNGILESQMYLVYILSKKSRNQASALFAEIVKGVQDQNIRSDIKNEQFFYMLARLVEPSLGRDPAFRDLMNYFIDVALKAGCGVKNPKDSDGFCYRLGLVVPLMEKVDAKRVAPMKHLARRAAFPYEWSAGLIAYADIYQNGSIDDLRAVPTYPDFPEIGQFILIRKVMESGDFERARKLVDEFTWEGTGKQEVLKQLDHEQRIVKEDTSAQILKQAEGFEESEAFFYLFRMATEIGTKNRQSTLKLLDRASELLAKVSPERRQMQYQVGIAARYCQVKSDRCFTMIEPIIRKMNELVNSATSLDGVDTDYLRNGEWNMTAAGGVGSLLTDLAQNAVYFALCDFDRAMALSSQFERREIRMMSQLKLAQGWLAGPPKKPLFSED